MSGFPWSVVIAIALTGVAAFQSWLARRPGKSRERQRRRILAGYAATAVTAILSGLQACRTGTATTKLLELATKQSNAELYISDIAPALGRWQIHPGGRADLNVILSARDTTAENVVFYVATLVEPSKVGLPELRARWLEFRQSIVSDMDPRTSTVSKEHALEKSIEDANLSEERAAGLLDGTLKLTVFAYAKWTNPSGSESHFYSCQALSGPVQLLLFDMPHPWTDCTSAVQSR